jgi:hypothetical protein
VGLTVNWRQEILKRWGIKSLENADGWPEAVLWTTRCSKTKNGVRRGLPKDLYVSSVNKYFYVYMEERGLRYGVLSDKYGLHFDDEELLYYDIHPSELNQHEKKQLGQIIRHKALARGFTQIAFYSPSPLMSVPYFEMLHHSGLGLFYATNLKTSVWG